MSYQISGNVVPDFIARDLDLAIEESGENEELEVINDLGYEEWLDKKLRKEGI